MGVQCKFLGHVRDATEFEEHHERRPGGTVLICREYQVCRRCGDREEMYRNEQVLAKPATEADRPVVDATGRLGTGTDEPKTDQSGTEEDARQNGSRSGAGDTASTSPADCGDQQVSEPADSEPADSEPVTDDAVIISAPPGASGSASNATQAQINCTRCEQAWRRDATSLRDGDLCPACRKAYVEEMSATSG